MSSIIISTIYPHFMPLDALGLPSSETRDHYFTPRTRNWRPCRRRRLIFAFLASLGSRTLCLPFLWSGSLSTAVSFPSTCGGSMLLSAPSRPLPTCGDASATTRPLRPRRPRTKRSPVREFIRSDQPLTSTWSHKSYFSQIADSGKIGSKAPRTVVPQVQLTKNGLWPLAMEAFTSLSSSEGIMWPLEEQD